jgi:selenocysteine-specific elongation factor
VEVGSERVVAPEPFDGLIRQCVDAVAAHHESYPTDAFVGLAAVAGRIGARVPEEVVRAALDAAATGGGLVSEGSGYCTPGHRAHAADPELARKLGEELSRAGLAPEPLEPLARSLGAELAELRRVAEHATREGQLVRVASDHFFDAAAITSLRERVEAYLREHEQIDPAAYKQLTGQTRKFTVPLMEYFDTEKLTLRRGNVRVLRKR